MASEDGSGKCDAHETNNETDIVAGALYNIKESEKIFLDKAESLGFGYREKMVTIQNSTGEECEALIYCALRINALLKPYCWYLNHVVIGAIETQIPTAYLAKIKATHSIVDLDKTREAEQRAIYK